MSPKTLPIPAKLNLFAWTRAQKFHEHPEGVKGLANYHAAIKKQKRNRLFLILVPCIFVFFLFFIGQILWGSIAAFFGVPFVIVVIGYFSDNPVGAKQANILNNLIERHCVWIAKDLAETYFCGSYRYFCFGSHGFIYTNEMCAYISAQDSLLVVLHKSNIKNIIRNRVRVESVTTSSIRSTGESKNTFSTAVGIDPFETRKHTSSSQVTTTTIDKYEWHFEIISNFLDYPSIIWRLPDNEFAKNETARAYGVLMP
jgi:hypothetical protein